VDPPRYDSDTKSNVNAQLSFFGDTINVSGSGQDRNLWVDYVVVSDTLVQAEGGAAILDRGGGALFFDGRDVLTGGEGLLLMNN
jgi:hypothetical protein